MEFYHYLSSQLSLPFKEISIDVEHSVYHQIDKFFIDDFCSVFITDKADSIDVSLRVDEDYPLKYDIVREIKRYFTHFSPDRIRFLSGNKKLFFGHNVNDDHFDLFSLYGIEFLNFSVRSYNILRRNGCRTIGDVSMLTYDKLSNFRHIGRKSLNEIEEIMLSFGFRIKGGMKDG